MTTSIEFFKTHKWLKIENYISKETTALLYHHMKQSAIRLVHIEDMYGYGSWKDNKNYNNNVWGSFYDPQCYGVYSRYSDPIFDALMEHKTSDLNNFTGLNLVPTYNYCRLYATGVELEKHKDRPACEISVTLCLGYDVSNVNEEKYPDWDWPMFIKDSENPEGIPIHLKPGDAIVYRGCEVEHWREPFWGKNHAQVFLHYNDKNGPFGESNLYDGRPYLGIPLEGIK